MPAPNTCSRGDSEVVVDPRRVRLSRKKGWRMPPDTVIRHIRWLNKLYADIMGYFWSPCPICGQMFGGHECASECLYTEPLKQIGNAWLRHPDGTSKELPNMPVYSRAGKCVCWRCNEKAAAHNAPNDELCHSKQSKTV